jgi:protein phosphatase
VRRTARGIVVDFAELSDPGRDPSKRDNEDACGFTETALGLLSVVCDGMGGHAAGRSASQTAVRVILERGRNAAADEPAAQMLHAAVNEAGAAVHALGGDAPRESRPGSTCVAALLGDAGLVSAHVGDSRLMLIRTGHLTRLTRDHTVVRQLVDAGMLTEAAAVNHPDANQITRALGMTPTVEVELRTDPLELSPQDVLVLTSDGITDLIPDPEILELVQENIGRGSTAVCQRMVSLANLRGGHDNLTVQTLHVLQLSQPRLATRQFPAGEGRTVLMDDGAGTSTAVPTQRSPVALDLDGRAPQPTLPAQDIPAPTVLEERSPSPPGKTVLDESPVPEPSAGRTTQPDLAALARAAGTAGVDPEQTSSTAAVRRRRLVVRLGALSILLLLGLLLAWWGRKTVSRSDDEEPPPPAPTPAASSPDFHRWRRPHHRRRPDMDLRADPDVPPRAPIGTSAPVDSAPPRAFP